MDVIRKLLAAPVRTAVQAFVAWWAIRNVQLDPVVLEAVVSSLLVGVATLLMNTIEKWVPWTSKLFSLFLVESGPSYQIGSDG